MRLLKRSGWARNMGTSGLVACSVLAAGTLSGCKERSSDWDAYVGYTEPVALSGSVALMDEPLNRLVFVTSESTEEVSTVSYPVGLNVTTTVASADKSKLFVLTAGEYPRTKADDEGPQLMVFDGGTAPKWERTFQLDDPMKRLAVDPLGEWVAAYQGDATVTNPNELVLLSLTGSSDKPVSRTIRSFGGAPQELIFTDELSVPQGGTRRFLIVKTDRDLTLVDLENVERDEVTVQLPENADKVPYVPAQIVYDDGEPEVLDDSRIAVRLLGTSDIMLLQLGASTDKTKDFKVIVSIADVGGVPSSIDFVRTDGGLRLAALVPDASRATLVNPESTYAEFVDLPQRFDQMTRITSLVEGTPDGGDVALLWGLSNQVAFWSLGSTSATPYRSIDSTELGMQVQRVIDVPPPNQHLKVLVGASTNVFFVLDLKKRESFPLDTAGVGFQVEASQDGARLWVSSPGRNEFSAVHLNDLHPQALYVSPGVDGVFDIENARGSRSALALHLENGWAATVLDAEAPNSTKTAYFPSLELGGIQ